MTSQRFDYKRWRETSNQQMSLRRIDSKTRATLRRESERQELDNKCSRILSARILLSSKEIRQILLLQEECSLHKSHKFRSPCSLMVELQRETSLTEERLDTEIERRRKLDLERRIRLDSEKMKRRKESILFEMNELHQSLNESEIWHLERDTSTKLKLLKLLKLLKILKIIQLRIQKRTSLM